MFTADQLVAHAIGDYILQSHWLATEKTKSHRAAAIHALSYSLPFVFLSASWAALAVIIVTHFFIDRYRLARYVVWLKNGPYTYEFEYESWLGDVYTRKWKPVTNTGFPDDVPPWLSTWLLIVVDNILHVVINGLSIYFL